MRSGDNDILDSERGDEVILQLVSNSRAVKSIFIFPGKPRLTNLQ